MDDFLRPPPVTQGPHGATMRSKTMMPTSPISTEVSEASELTGYEETIGWMREDLHILTASSVTEADFIPLVEDLKSTIRSEVAALKAEVTTLDHPVQALESAIQQSQNLHTSAETAATRQGNMLLGPTILEYAVYLRHQTERR
ncbi:Hypothetical predicted protein [Pelobates cultripes]|uniref:Uncharacterized protein n=1 Tax=Pelobates cultripes TaxID=61616 RepID=A0AAD1RX53_PELCU|nr:Hypothetical predicted protein [Pelobates cultripes]